MNDNEIMKSLDACDNCFCENCFYRPKLIYCREDLCKDALNLINYQKTEIERLSKEIITLKYDLQVASEESVEWKVQAIKEFAEKLKKRLFYNCGDINYTEVCDTQRLIDNLVKEMTEE